VELDEAALTALEEPVSRWQARRERAANRLSQMEGRRFCFAILGLKPAVSEFEFLPTARLQAIVEPPGEIELAGSLRNQTLFSAIGRYSHHIRFELAVSTTEGSDVQAPFNLAWWIISALRVRSLAEVLVPAVADHSWSVISGVPERSCHAQLLEDVPQATRLSEQQVVPVTDLEWIRNHLQQFANLLEDARFRIAVDALCTHHHHPSYRMMAAVLWSGVEALFGINAELSFRIACFIATTLEPRGSGRRDLYYGTRSKAVHGANVKEGELKEHIIQVRQLLSRLLCCFTEGGRIPSASELEDQLFV
jgi:hypothetical protein